MTEYPLPKLVTFDGEARSGKGTIVQTTKDYLRDTMGYKVMLIDAGQVFRVLVVAVGRAGVDIEDPNAIDRFLGDDAEAEKCVMLVKEVYHMDKPTRDALLYTNQVGEDSAKIGARPLAQTFKDELLKKWLRDARTDGYEIVLLDGRALEEVGDMLEREGLCEFSLGLYFVCDPVTGARRTLGLAKTPYDRLSEPERVRVDELVAQIGIRNRRDSERDVQPIVRPKNAPTITLPVVESESVLQRRPMFVVDTSADMKKDEMSLPISRLVASCLSR